MGATRVPYIVFVLFATFVPATAAFGDDNGNASSSSPGGGFVDAQRRASEAANAYASTLAKKGTALYTAQLRKALTTAYATSVLTSSKAVDEMKTWLKDNSDDLSDATPQQLQASIVDIVGGTPVDGDDLPIQPPPQFPEMSKLDRDPRYTRNLVDLAETPRGRLYGGLPTKRFLNTVAITGSGLCTGVVVAANAVLTAQHCICDGVTESVFVGADTLAEGDEYAIKATSVMKQCGSPDATMADVGMVFIAKTFQSTVTPAKLAASSEIDRAATLRAVGFGKTENEVHGRKMMVDLPVASANCAGVVRLPVGPVSDSSYYGCNAPFELIAGAPLLNRDTCNGDSGGPLFIVDRDPKSGVQSFVLAAITSRAVTTKGLRPCGDGGIYVRVDRDVRSWVDGQLKSTTLSAH